MCARQMRHALVDYARARRAAKRGDGAVRFTLDDFDGAREMGIEELLAVDIPLDELNTKDARLAPLVELKYFAGLTDQEISAVAVSTDSACFGENGSHTDLTYGP